MLDITDPERPPQLPATPLATRLRQLEWRRRVRWFAAEFFVVVSGILVALWLQASFQSRQQAEREIDYLRELAADLRQTEASIDATRTAASQLERTSAMLLQSFYPGVEVSEDSIRSWLFQVQSFSSVRLGLSTARALATHEAGLVQDDSLRVAILGLLDQADQFHASQESGIATFFIYVPRFTEKVSFTETLMWRYDDGAGAPLVPSTALPALPVPPGTPTHPFPADIAALLQDRQLFHTLEGLYQIHASFTRAQGRMLTRVKALRERVESVLEQRTA